MIPNIQAFLDTIAFSEGTFGEGDNGYNILVGSGQFHSYADHPRKLVEIPAYGIRSTAAGRYQILERYFDAYKKSLKLRDFSPASQDAIAIQIIKEQDAYEDILAGRITDAIKKCANIWASFPGAGYKQHENKIENLVNFFIRQANKYIPTDKA